MTVKSWVEKMLEDPEIKCEYEKIKQEDEMIELEKRIGFWKNDSNTEEGRKEVEAAQGSITDEEFRAVISYIESSKMSVGYMGWANCRVCGERLGALDMRTPDNNFVFPERYEHYVIKHNVRPPEDFVRAAVAWFNKE